jgi:hypothetical protein
MGLQRFNVAFNNGTDVEYNPGLAARLDFSLACTSKTETRYDQSRQKLPAGE